LKIKTIEKILNNKFNAFVKSITDKDVAKLVKQNTLISGGCIASMLLNEDVNDYDLYFTNRETVFAVTKYFVDKFIKAQGKSYTHTITIEDTDDRIAIRIASDGKASYTESSKNINKYQPIFLTSNAITLNNKIQLINRFYGDAEEIHKNFDYVHVTNYWLSSTRKVYVNQKALESLLTKELKYIGSLYPLCSIFRLRKFLKRGFYINAGEMLKIMWGVNSLDLHNINVLREQLIGVDVSYFHFLLKDLDKKGDVSYDYICELIDKIF